MHWFGTFIILKQLDLIIIITTIGVFNSIESISDKIWLNQIQNLSEKIHDYNSDINTKENQPVNEGFILLADNQKKPSLIASRSTDSQISIEIDDKELINNGVTFDGSGDTIEPTSETAVTISNETITISSSTTTLITSTTTPVELILSGYSTFLINVDSTNASAVLTNILEQFSKTFPYQYNVTSNVISNQFSRSLSMDLSITFFTDNNITILNNLFQILSNIVSTMGLELRSVDKCGTKETGKQSKFENDIQFVVTDVTSCYLIDLCNLCGINPRRGVCLPENNVSKCECFVNQNDPTITYVGEFCNIQQQKPITSISSSWTSIVIGILAGLAGLFCVITSFLLVMTCVRRRSSQKQNDPVQDENQVNRLSYLPRAHISTSISIKNVHNHLNNSTFASSSNRSDSDLAIDSAFFRELDQKLNKNLHTTITEQNTKTMLTSLSSDVTTISTYDPIDELDALLDNEDITMEFHDPIGLDNQIFEMINPNLKLPRLSIDSQ